MDCRIAATLRSLRQSILLIGYDSAFQGDGGVGQKLARQVARWGMPNVNAIAVQQLSPELIDWLSEVDIAIFVETYPGSTGQEVQVYSVEPSSISSTGGYWCEPQKLLTMTQALYYHAPKAWWIAIPRIATETTVSDYSDCQIDLEMALEQIEDLLKTARTEPCLR